MPVSPADFEFYSRVTGQPIPRDPAARMQMAPQVYAMRRGPLSGIKDRLGGAVRGAILGGAVAGAASLLLRDLNDGQSGEVNTPGENYGQKSVPHQTNVAKDIAETVKAEEIATEGVDVTQANELASRQSVTPDYDDPSTVRGKTSDLIGRVFGTVEQAPSQLAQYGALNPQEQEIRDLMTAYESAEGQALAGQDQSISPFQVGGAMPSLMAQNKPMRELQKSMPGATKEQVKAAMYPSSDIEGSAVGAQSIIFPESASVKGMSIYPEATGEGGIGRADIIHKNVSKEEKDLPVEERGRYVYMLSAEGQERAQRIASGEEQTPSKASAFLTDFTKKGQLISMDPLAPKRTYGIKPSLSEIL